MGNQNLCSVTLQTTGDVTVSAVSLLPDEMKGGLLEERVEISGPSKSQQVQIL